MSSNRQYGDRSSRQWDGYDDRRDDWRKPPRGAHRDAHHKYGGERHGSAERPGRRREYSTSPKRVHGRDSLGRDWGRKSPAKRHPSPPEKRHRRFTERDDDADYRYKRVLEDEPSRSLPDPFARGHTTKDVKRTLSQEDDSKYVESAQDFRQRYPHEESTPRQQHDNGTSSRRFIGNRDRNGYELGWEHSGESAQSPESLVKSRETIMDPVDHSPRGLPLRPSPGQSFQVDANHQRTAAAAAATATTDQTKSTMGFQRFLDVLNKGVNVAALNQIVTQGPAELNDQPLAKKAPKDEQWAAAREAERHDGHLEADLWSELREPQELDSPRRKDSPLSDKAAAHKGERERSLGETSAPAAPSVPDAVTETSREENKQKHEQMLNILEAIGVNLGSEELDQMSLRIQQRLYGRKEGKASSEPDQKPADSPRRKSGSPSSRSSFSPPAEEYHLTADLYDVSQRGECLIEIQPDPQYCQESSSSSASRDNKESQEMTDGFSQNPMYTVPKPAAPPVLPAFPNCLPPPLPLPGALPPPPLPGALPPPLSLPYPPPPPVLPLARRPVFPHMHPFLPRPPVPPGFPGFLGPMMRPHPGPFGNPVPPMNPPYEPFSATQQSKGPARPRCLQVVQVENALTKTPATGDL